MKHFPFENIKEDRFELSKRYGLIECVNGVNRLTVKCKAHYEPISYLRYLQGKIEKPKKPEQENSYEKTLNELLEM